MKFHNNWGTPPQLISYIKTKYFNNMDFFDPCPLFADFNGLEINWEKRNFINPPYDRKTKEQFILKAYIESLKGNQCVLLLPVSTSTAIFHDIIKPNANIEFLRGRVKFWENGKPNNKKPSRQDSFIIEFFY